MAVITRNSSDKNTACLSRKCIRHTAFDQVHGARASLAAPAILDIHAENISSSIPNFQNLPPQKYWALSRRRPRPGGGGTRRSESHSPTPTAAGPRSETSPDCNAPAAPTRKLTAMTAVRPGWASTSPTLDSVDSGGGWRRGGPARGPGPRGRRASSLSSHGPRVCRGGPAAAAPPGPA